MEIILLFVFCLVLAFGLSLLIYAVKDNLAENAQIKTENEMLEKQLRKNKRKGI